MQVFTFPGGLLAYVVLGDRSSALMLQRPGRPARTVVPDVGSPLTVEDGRTLAWGGNTYDSYDVLPVPRDASGCPVRSHYRDVVRDTPELRIAGFYRGAGSDGGVESYRICWKATGQDRIVFTADTLALRESLIAIQGPYVALPEVSTLVLDRGEDGSLAGLATSPAGAYVWTHDGQPRSAG